MQIPPIWKPIKYGTRVYLINFQPDVNNRQLMRSHSTKLNLFLKKIDLPPFIYFYVTSMLRIRQIRGAFNAISLSLIRLILNCEISQTLIVPQIYNRSAVYVIINLMYINIVYIMSRIHNTLFTLYLACVILYNITLFII